MTMSHFVIVITNKLIITLKAPKYNFIIGIMHKCSYYYSFSLILLFCNVPKYYYLVTHGTVLLRGCVIKINFLKNSTKQKVCKQQIYYLSINKEMYLHLLDVRSLKYYVCVY